MKNIEIAWILNEIGDLLELKGENRFKVRAYRKGARALQRLSEPVETVAAEGRLQKIDGIGPALAAKISEYLSTGVISLHQELLSEIPAGLIEISQVPGVDPKLAYRLFYELGVSNITALEAACRGRKVRTLSGIGPRTEWNILRGIRTMRSQGQVLLGVALPLAEELTEQIRHFPGVIAVSVAGSVRRRCEMVGDIDLVAAAENPAEVISLFTKMPKVKDVIEQDAEKVRVKLGVGVQVDLRIVPPSQYWLALHYYTGSVEYNRRLRRLAESKGWKLTESGIEEIKSGKQYAINQEEEIYDLLALEYVPPEMRENQGELELAADHRLPKLITQKDWLGELHCHSKYSDGVNSLEELAEHARRLGYKYLAVCDHSRSLTIAGGLSVNELREQGDRIRALNRRWNDFRLLRGIEVDILADGTLDYPDEILAEMDIVVASIHSGFRQPKEQITARVLAAIENPHVDIIAHPTGRLLARREPYEIDIEQVIAKAREHRTILEINSSPDRLDLNDRFARMARDAGVLIAINTDAHSLEQFEYRHLGIGVARRAWLEPAQVVNTWEWSKLGSFLQEKAVIAVK